MPLLARDVMQRDLVTIPQAASCLDVLHLFAEALIGGAPVLADDGAVLGVVSATDLIRAVDQACDEDVDAGEAGRDPAGALAEMTAGDVATPEVYWVAEDATLDAVAQKMRELGIHRVLVGSNGDLAGMITTFDLLPAVGR